MFADALTAKLAAFVRDIGIDVRAATFEEPTFLPGLDICRGSLRVDEEKLAYPGDILHEAGHIAVADPAERRQEKLSPSPGDEMAAMAWSYAAAVHLGVDPKVVFHTGGYGGGGPAYAAQFAAGHYVGVPLFQLYDMTVEPRHAARHGVAPFPHMLRWVRGGDVP
jgi:hypothetical protein